MLKYIWLDYCVALKYFYCVTLEYLSTILLLYRTNLIQLCPLAAQCSWWRIRRRRYWPSGRLASALDCQQQWCYERPLDCPSVSCQDRSISAAKVGIMTQPLSQTVGTLMCKMWLCPALLYALQKDDIFYSLLYIDFAGAVKSAYCHVK